MAMFYSESNVASKAMPGHSAARLFMKKDTLIDLYWILDAVQKGSTPDAQQVGACFIALRDELMLPDSEAIVDHIRAALDKQRTAAQALTERALGRSRRRPLPESRLHAMMATLAGGEPDSVAVAFARLVEEAHGIRR
jgi:hypothetical protein